MDSFISPFEKSPVMLIAIGNNEHEKVHQTLSKTFKVTDFKHLSKTSNISKHLSNRF